MLVRPIAHASVHFCGKHNFLTAPAALGEPASDNLLSDTFADLPSIDIGSIEEINAQVEGFIHDGVGIFLLRLWAEIHRPQAQSGNLKAGATKVGIFHIYLQKMVNQ